MRWIRKSIPSKNSLDTTEASHLKVTRPNQQEVIGPFQLNQISLLKNRPIKTQITSDPSTILDFIGCHLYFIS